MSRKRLFLWLFSGMAAAFAGWAALSLYDSLVRQPRQIQQRLLGREVAGLSSLESFDPDVGGYGEALFRWEYHLAASEMRALEKNCKPRGGGRCDIAIEPSGESGEGNAVFLYRGSFWLEKWWD